MGVFDNVGDVPGQLSREALQITLSFEPNVPNVGQATISWNIPVSDNPTTKPAYAGIVIVACDQPVNLHNIPKDGVDLTPDPTLDMNIFSGDIINNARVLAYIYEPDVIAQGGTPTTSIVVNNYDENNNYYIAGYIMDTQRRFDQGGVRAYSDRVHNYKNQPGQKAQQPVLLAFDPTRFSSGVLPTDGTNLVAGAKYQFQIIHDSGYPNGRNTVTNFLIALDGAQAGTYGDLIKEINKQIAIQSYKKTIISPVYPGQGIYYWNGTILQQFDGQGNFTTISNLIVSGTDPSQVQNGTYWYNPVNSTLQMWNGTSWVSISTINFPSDPTKPAAGTYWWNSSSGLAYTRCGNAWCEVSPTQIYQSASDPACPTTPVNCSYWYNSSTSTLNTWANGAWTSAYAVTWNQAPNALSAGTYWFDLTNSLLFTRSTSLTTWTNQPFINSTTDPSLVTTNAVVAGTLWYNSTNETLQQRDPTNTTWLPLSVLVWPSDPTNIASCSLWYDSSQSPPVLNQYNVITQSWTPVTPYYDQSQDPYGQPNLAVGSVWVNTVTGILEQLGLGTITGGTNYNNGTFSNIPLSGGSGSGAIATIGVSSGAVSSVTITFGGSGYIVGDILSVNTPAFSGSGFSIPITNVESNTVLSVWNGSAWEAQTSFINYPSDPTTPATGDVWYNPSNNTFAVWGTPTAGAWNTITPTISVTPPNELTTGQLWFNNVSDPNTLSSWNGTGWSNIRFITVQPFIQKRQVWYNTNTDQLLRWDGRKWNPIQPKVIAHLDNRGNCLFETTERGSNQVVILPIPNAINWMASGAVTYGTGSADYINDSWSPYEFFPFGTQSPVDGYALPFPISYNGMITGLDYFGDFGWGEPNGSMNASDGTDLTLNSWVQFSGSSGAYSVPYRAIPIAPNAFLWSQLKPSANILIPVAGQDGVSGTPTYAELGVGTDGNPDERRNLIGIVRERLGYPTVTVELTDAQLDRAVTNAIETFRQKSSMATFPAAFFLDIEPYNQVYKLTNRAVGYNKIVEVLAGYRFTSAFLSSAMGAGVYGQVVLQHLYNMGTFDLLSYYIVSQYVESLELLFATRLTYWWDTNTRELRFHQSFVRPERILLAVTIEKTEQELFQDRYIKQWLQRYAMAEAMMMLAQIRGKYSTLPGASGSVTLNASDLKTQAQEYYQLCQDEIDNYIVQDVESYGAYGNFSIG